MELYLLYQPPRELDIFPTVTVISALKDEYCCSYDSINVDIFFVDLIGSLQSCAGSRFTFSLRCQRREHREPYNVLPFPSATFKVYTEFLFGYVYLPSSIV